MTLLLRLATRNLLRNTRRTMLTTIVIVAAIGVLILGEGFVSGTEQNFVTSAINSTVGHITVRPSDYPADMGQQPVDVLLDVTPAMRSFLDRHAEGWTERVLFQPTLIAGEDWTRVQGIGYDPNTDDRVFRRDLWTLKGREPTSPSNEIMVSPGIASLLDLSLGQSVVLQLRTHEGAINALDLTVVGIVNTTNASIDMNSLFAPRELVARLIASPKPSHVSLRLASRYDIDDLLPSLRESFGPQAELVTWQTETAELLRLQATRRRTLQFLVFVLMALSAFGMANTILMAAHERVREVGTLRAMGMSRPGVIRMFLTEGALMGVMGSLLGAAWGGGLVAHWAVTPIDFSNYVQNTQMSGFSFSVLLYTDFRWSTVAGSILFGTAVAVLASIYPAWVASSLVPADAVRAD